MVVVGLNGFGKFCARATVTGTVWPPSMEVGMRRFFQVHDACVRCIDAGSGNLTGVNPGGNQINGVPNQGYRVVGAAVRGTQVSVKQQDVGTGIHGQHKGLIEGIVIGDGLHEQLIADDHPGIAHLIAEHLGYRFVGERGGIIRIDVTVKQVSGHDHVRHEFIEDELVRGEFALLPGAGDVCEPEMGVGHGAAVTGEVLGGGDDVTGGMLLHESDGVVGYDGFVGGVGAFQSTNGRTVAVDVHIDHRGQVYVQAGLVNPAGHDFGLATGSLHVFEHIAGEIGRKGAGIAVVGVEPGHTPPPPGRPTKTMVYRQNPGVPR